MNIYNEHSKDINPVVEQPSGKIDLGELGMAIEDFQKRRNALKEEMKTLKDRIVQLDNKILELARKARATGLIGY